jgi:sigma-E factor negative regulatory protein RseC
MIEEVGVVTETDGVMAKVIIQKKGACEGCSVQETCKPTEKGMEIEVLNTVQARVGQTVRVSIGAYSYLKSSMIAYGIPLVFFIGGAILGKNAGDRYFTDLNSDLVAAIAGFVSLIISLLFIKLFSGHAGSKIEYKPHIEEIINS